MTHLHGDELTAALLPVVADLVVAVHDLDTTAVADVFDVAARLAGDDLASARHLAVLAAGMCSEDHAVSAALGWTLNPSEYHRLRSSADALTASLRAGRTAPTEGAA